MELEKPKSIELYNENDLKQLGELQLMVYQNIINEINNDIEEKIKIFVNNLQDIEQIYVSVWVNETLFFFFQNMRNYGILHKYFPYNINFTINKRMKDNEFVTFNVGMKIHSSYPLIPVEGA